MSVTRAVFRVCMTLKKVLENFAETTDFTLLLTMFLGSDLLVIFLKASQMQNYTEKGDSTVCSVPNMEYVVLSLTSNSSGFFALVFHLSLLLIWCHFFSAKTTYIREIQGYWIGPVSSEHNQTLWKDLCTPLAFYLSCHHPFVVLKPCLLGFSCLTSCSAYWHCSLHILLLNFLLWENTACVLSRKKKKKEKSKSQCSPGKPEIEKVQT